MPVYVQKKKIPHDNGNQNHGPCLVRRFTGGQGTVGNDVRDQEGEEKSAEQCYFLSVPW